MRNLHSAVQGQLRRVPDLERIAARLHRTHAQPGHPEDDSLGTVVVSTWPVGSS